MDARRIAIPAKLGLALLAAWPALTIGLSAVGERVALVQAVAVLGLLPALLGAVAWLRAGQRSRKVYLRKRLFALASLALALSVPLTHWPFEVSLRQARRQLVILAIQAHQETATFPTQCGMFRVRSAVRIPITQMPNCFGIHEEAWRLDLGGSSVEARVWGRKSDFWLAQVERRGPLALLKNGKLLVH